ncbi:MAG: adenylate kinase [Leptospirales bacterium]
MGPPGSGKGTQSQSIVDKVSIIQISTGDMLRKAVSEETELGVKAKGLMDSGELVPDEVINGIIEERIREKDCENGFIADGFPRTNEQAKTLDELLEREKKQIDHVVFFDVPEKELIMRLLARAEKENRTDDTLEVIKNRLIVFRKNTESLIEYYQKRNLIRYIDGTGNPEDVKERLFRAIGE